MSKNLYKSNWVTIERQGKRVIDNNDLAQKRIDDFNLQERQRLAQQLVAEGNGENVNSDFVEGLDAMQISRLTEDFGDAEASDLGGFAEPDEDTQAMVQQQIDAMMADAQAQAQAIIDNAQAQAEQIMNEYAEQGRAQGYQEGFDQGKREADNIVAQANEDRVRLEGEYQQLVDELEPQMVDALTDIFEHVFNIDFREDKSIVLHLLQNTLSRVEPGNNMIVHVSSMDYDMVTDERNRLEEAVTTPNASLEIIEDPMLKENECIVETDGGVFDCSVGVELSELTRKLKLLSFDRKRN
ncbi:MAG: type III secretion system stator protein SctL [Butyrivibrio sp.]|nr:type III secretion system stator protein SctL [Butyrivibrio sp.]